MRYIHIGCRHRNCKLYPAVCNLTSSDWYVAYCLHCLRSFRHSLAPLSKQSDGPVLAALETPPKPSPAAQDPLQAPALLVTAASIVASHSRPAMTKIEQIGGVQNYFAVGLNLCASTIPSSFENAACIWILNFNLPLFPNQASHC
jgi:hypothetical protein